MKKLTITALSILLMMGSTVHIESIAAPKRGKAAPKAVPKAPPKQSAPARAIEYISKSAKATGTAIKNTYVKVKTSVNNAYVKAQTSFNLGPKATTKGSTGKATAEGLKNQTKEFYENAASLKKNMAKKAQNPTGIKWIDGIVGTKPPTTQAPVQQQSSGGPAPTLVKGAKNLKQSTGQLVKLKKAEAQSYNLFR